MILLYITNGIRGNWMCVHIIICIKKWLACASRRHPRFLGGACGAKVALNVAFRGGVRYASQPLLWW